MVSMVKLGARAGMCEISRGPRVPDHFGGSYPRVLTPGFWGSEKVCRSGQ